RPAGAVGPRKQRLRCGCGGGTGGAGPHRAALPGEGTAAAVSVGQRCGFQPGGFEFSIVGRVRRHGGCGGAGGVAAAAVVCPGGHGGPGGGGGADVVVVTKAGERGEVSTRDLRAGAHRRRPLSARFSGRYWYGGVEQPTCQYVHRAL